MKDIHLDRILTENRRRLGVTQEQLAEYLGVSKAAVSKWETGMTYPDILMLPRLASYFDITIDELIDYKPQLSTEEIRTLYRQLANEFASGSFEQALELCRNYSKQYFSCYPLLFQIGSLLVNHFIMAPSQEAAEHMINDAADLFLRVKNHTEDPTIGKEALQMEAYCHLILRQPEEVLHLLSEEPSGAGPAEPILASAYRMTGDLHSAVRILQTGIFKSVLALFNLMASYMNLSQNDPDAFSESCRRMNLLEETFHMDSLHPGIMLTCYFEMAQGWMTLGKREKAMECLRKYTHLAVSDIYPLRLHRDDYFTLLDEWIEKAPALGEYPPRDDKVIRHSITQSLAENPAFSELSGDPQFQHMITLLKQNEEKK